MNENYYPAAQNNPPNPFRRIFSWDAPERHWTPKDRAWYVSYGLLFIVLIAMAAILHEYILIVAIIAFVFLWFTQAAVPPEIITHTITSLGLKTFEKVFRWNDIKHFWFSERHGILFLNLEIQHEAISTGTRRLSLIINEEELKKLFGILIQYVDYGDKDEIGFNFFVKLLHGGHVPITSFLPEDIETEEDFLITEGINRDANINDLGAEVGLKKEEAPKKKKAVKKTPKKKAPAKKKASSKKAKKK